ncbi:MAG: electron transfer flavoprotein subunit beta/FixA family protein [Deltaproteobacteria bacterium]|jgi:electron transfer flavoprotein beta subunit|nr:electron transfer flavoprotein subunit beta/FixA family protein [Deltaproteobacteria bacterium]
MDIVVLVKQVPDTESLVQIADDGVSIKTQDIKWIMNPYDELAVEAALQIKEAQGGTVTILSLGPDKAIETIRTALAMGADQGVHINDPAAQGSDSLAVAKLLVAALKEIPYELIIAGHRAVDEDNYQVASAVAELLGIPQVSMVNKVELADGKIICNRTIEGGTVVVEASLPALFTTQRGLNEPRYASLPGIMKAKKKPVDVKTVADLGVDPAQVGAANRKLKIKSMSLPPERQAVRMVEGEAAADKAAALVKILHDETKII